MIVAEALDALWSLGWAFLIWLVVLAAVGTAVLLGTVAGLWWVCRAVWRFARAARIYLIWKAS
ncbi:hypothetical protein [Streptomyces olivaceus]|uniref:hypothetical protein n=1 Tax=Streptomyces olivaceus TaxID=47716 RepID=UPI0022EEEDC1|nr:hypothetical protein [Streptomyces olivaceus]GHI91302.1 hypothetical protein TPA0905_07730 [Streptomyces olivaceus]